MGDRPSVVLYCEDSGHEQFARALLGRIARELELRLDVRTASGRGGHAQAMNEFRGWQRVVAGSGGIGFDVPELLVLMIDANCEGWTHKRRDVEQSIDGRIFPRYAIGCPEPHVERWCFADPLSVQEVLGVSAPPDPGKCERGLYKELLRKTIRLAGQPILTNEMEYAPELVDAMDLYRAGRNQPSLKHFVDEVRGALQSLRAGSVTPLSGRDV